MVVGPDFLVLAVGFATYEAWFIRHALVAEGVVTQLIANGDASHSVAYAPVFKFTTPDGRQHTVQSGAASNPPGFTVGEQVSVLFNPQNPEAADIDSFWQLWGLAAG